MTDTAVRRRRHGGRLRTSSSAALLSVIGAASLMLLLLPSSAAAVPQDTIPVQAAAEDTLAEPPPTLPPIGVQAEPSAASAIWVWDRQALLDEVALTVADLLERIPGVPVYRGGVFLEPRAVSPLGGTAGRIEIEVDGFLLDPLLAPTYDLAMVDLASLDSVVVERRLDALRVRLRTVEPRDPRPYSRVEAGTGDPNANVFRGIFMAPRLLFGPVAAAIDRFDSNGAGPREPTDEFSGWLKWGWLAESGGVQLELHNVTLDRDQGTPWPGRSKRRDLVLRARRRLAPGLVGEAYWLSSKAEFGPIDGGPTDVVSVARKTSQIGLRTGFDAGAFAAEAAVRTNSREELPRLGADLGARLAIGNAVLLRADGHLADWRDSAATRTWDVRATMAPQPWLTLFGEFTTGSRGAPGYVVPADEDTTGSGTGGGTGTEPPEPLAEPHTIVTDRTAARVGAEIRLGRMTLHGAALRIDDDSVPPFGLPYDSASATVVGGARSGVEVFAKLPLPVDWLWLEGTYVGWTQSTQSPYLPRHEFRSALVLRATPGPSGALEFSGRLENTHRSATAVLGAGPELPPGLGTSPARNILDGYLQIRIYDLRIFARFDDLLGDEIEDLPGLPIRGPRLIYGVKWSFWN